MSKWLVRMEFWLQRLGGKCLTLVLGCSPGVGLMGPLTEFFSDTFDNHVEQKPVSDLCRLCHRPKLCGLEQMDHSACLREDREGNMLTCASFLHLSWSARPTREDILRFHFQIRLLSSSFFGWSPISLMFFVWFPRDLQIMTQSELKKIFHNVKWQNLFCHETSFAVRSLVWLTHQTKRTIAAFSLLFKMKHRHRPRTEGPRATCTLRSPI